MGSMNKMIQFSEIRMIGRHESGFQKGLFQMDGRYFNHVSFDVEIHALYENRWFKYGKVGLGRSGAEDSLLIQQTRYITHALSKYLEFPFLLNTVQSKTHVFSPSLPSLQPHLQVR